jgi:hypothetical protein
MNKWLCKLFDIIINVKLNKWPTKYNLVIFQQKAHPSNGACFEGCAGGFKSKNGGSCA